MAHWTEFVSGLVEKSRGPVPDLIIKSLKKIPVREVSRRIPWLKARWDKELETVMERVDHQDPYSGKHPVYHSMPINGVSHEILLKQMRHMARTENSWDEGKASGAVYHGGQHHIKFLNKVYGLFSQTNPIHSDIWPGINRMEAEVISMVSDMLGSQKSGSDVCGTLSSGGTESILLAMKACRDFSLVERGIKKPEIVVPVSAHAAFDKACQYFSLKKKTIPVGRDGSAIPGAYQKAVNRNTIALVASAPSFPHGAIDPVEEVSEIALKKGLWLHVDACLGGFLLPWLKDAYPVPSFDFSLPGVSSISVDTHKYGFGAKGSSVILYRRKELMHYQYFTASDWPGGLYFSPGFAGSRSGAVSAQAWAAMLSIGQDGYRSAALSIMKAATELRKNISKIDGLKLIGQNWWVITFSGTSGINIYEVMDRMALKKWSLNGLHHPSCLHFCVTLKHTDISVQKEFLNDLKEAVRWVRKNPGETDGLAPVYGMASSLPVGGAVDDVLKRYLDQLYSLKYKN